MKLLATAATILGLFASIAYGQFEIETTPYWQNSGGAGKYHTGLQWADLDRDGYLDLFLSNGNDIQMVKNYIFRNDAGNLPIFPTWQSSNNEYSGHCAVGDLNHDGYPELVVANFLGSGGFSTPNNMDAYLNSAGIMGTAPWWTSDDSTWAFSCYMGDIDGDGDLDVAFAEGTAYVSQFEQQRVYRNIGGTLEATPSWLSSNTSAMIDVTMGDVDNDGDLDLAYCGDDNHVMIYFNNNGDIDTLPGWQSFDVQSSNTLAFGDIDGDGWLDLAVADNYQLTGNGRFKVYHNNMGTLGTSPYWLSSTGGYGSAVAWCDLDGDGDQDLAAGRWWSEVYIYENTGLTLTTTPVWVSSSAYESVIEEIAFGDVDRDGVDYYADTIPIIPGRKLYYLKRTPLHSVDSVIVDGSKLDFSEYCYNLVDGWVSVGIAPVTSMVVYYQWSYKPDMGVSNWDLSSYVFANNLTPPVVAGDADGSGAVDIDDVVFLIAYAFAGGPAPADLGTGDVDCSSEIDIDDIVYLIAYIFTDGPEPCYL